MNRQISTIFSLIFFIAATAAQNSPVYNPCRGVDQGFAADVNDCKSYFSCVNEVSTKYTCPDDYVFDAATSTCRPSTKACPEAFCPEGTDKIGFKRIAGQCERYLGCAKGYMFEYKCADGLIFDDILERCEFVEDADCLNCPAVDPPGKVIRLPNKKDCSRYYVCAKGQAESKKCLPNLYYNEEEERCVASYECKVSDPYTLN